MAVTLKDIAEETGVTPTVVSHVLNDQLGHIRVSEVKRVRIEEVAKQMEYVPNLKARALATRKSYTLGLICSYQAVADNLERRAAADAYLSSALRGVESACRESGYHCLVSYCDLSNLETLVHPRAMQDGSMDGAVLIGYTSRDVVNKLASMHVPCVQIGSNIDPECHLDRAYADLDGGFEQALRYLADLGHRKVQLCLPAGPGPEYHTENFRKLDRCIGGVKAEAFVARGKVPDVTELIQHARELVGQGNLPTAFIAAVADAKGLAQGFSESGLACPRDYSLICFSSNYIDRSVAGAGVETPLSLLWWDGAETGRVAVRLLLDQLDEARAADGEAAVTVPCRLFPGASTRSV